MLRVMKFWKQNLMARLVSYFLLLSLLTVSLAVYLAYFRAAEDLQASIFDRLGAVAVLKENGLNRWVDEQRRNVVFVAWLPEVQVQATALLGDEADSSSASYRAAYALLSQYLEFVVTSTSDSQELFILDLDGRIILSTDKSHEGQSQANTLYFQRGRSATYVQKVYPSPLTAKPTITIATPLFDQDKRRVGVLAGHLNLSRIDQIILERTGLGESGETYLVDPNHHFVSETLFGQKGLFNGVHSEGIDSALQQNDGAGLYVNYAGVPVIGVYHWIDEQDMALLAEMSQAEALAPARRLAWMVFAVGLAGAGVLAVGVYWLARQIAHPILALTDAATRVAQGDLTLTAPVLTEDEIGVLARAFNQMTDQLRTTLTGLEERVAQRTEALRRQNEYLAALHDVTLGLIRRLDLSELLEGLVTRAGALMGTMHGNILLLEPSGTEMRVRVGTGVESDFVGYCTRPGEGLSGQVWQTGQPLVVDDYRVWAGRKPDSSHDVFRAAVGVPLKSGGQVVGVLSLDYLDEERTFGQSEVETLQRFAQLAVVALDNARLYTAAQEAKEATEAANRELSQALADLQTTQSQLVEAEKMAALGGLVAGVAHEINTPIGIGVTAASLLEQKTSSFRQTYQSGQMKRSELEKYLDAASQSSAMILHNLQRAAELIQSFKQVAVDQSSEERRMFAVKPYLDEILLSLHPKLKRTPLTVETRGDENLTLDSYPGVFAQIVTNLVMNSLIHAYEPGQPGHLTFDLKQKNGRFIFEYADDGQGIPPEHLSKIFDPFFTTKRGQGGSGLGLHIIYNLVTQKLGGTIRCESEVGKGTRFVIELPVEVN